MTKKKVGHKEQEREKEESRHIHVEFQGEDS